MAGPAFETILDLIYESAIVPERWPQALDAAANTVDAALASIVMVPHEIGLPGSTTIKPRMHWVGTPAGEKLIEDFAAVGDPSLENTRVARVSRCRRAGFISDYDLFAPEEIPQQRFYTEFLWPRGYGWVAATVIDSPTGDAIIASLERRRERGPFEREAIDRLDHLRPHLARSSLLALRLGLERARAMTEAMTRIGLPAAVVGQGGRLRATNPLFDGLEPDVVRFTRSRLSLAHAPADALLQQAFSRIASRRFGEPTTPGSVPLPAQAGRWPMILHVLPVCGSAHDVFTQADAIVVVTPVGQHSVATAAVLQGLFDLTPREAEVARLFGSALSVDAIAATLGIAELTVRAHVRAIKSKTGIERQAELVALLAGTALSNPGEPT